MWVSAARRQSKGTLLPPPYPEIASRRPAPTAQFCVPNAPASLRSRPSTAGQHSTNRQLCYYSSYCSTCLHTQPDTPRMQADGRHPMACNTTPHLQRHMQHDPASFFDKRCTHTLTMQLPQSRAAQPCSSDGMVPSLCWPWAQMQCSHHATHTSVGNTHMHVLPPRSRSNTVFTPPAPPPQTKTCDTPVSTPVGTHPRLRPGTHVHASSALCGAAAP